MTKENFHKDCYKKKKKKQKKKKNFRFRLLLYWIIINSSLNLLIIERTNKKIKIIIFTDSNLNLLKAKIFSRFLQKRYQIIKDIIFFIKNRKFQIKKSSYYYRHCLLDINFLNKHKLIILKIIIIKIFFLFDDDDLQIYYGDIQW